MAPNNTKAEEEGIEGLAVGEGHRSAQSSRIGWRMARAQPLDVTPRLEKGASSEGPRSRSARIIMTEMGTCELCLRDLAVATLRPTGQGPICASCVGRIALALPRVDAQLGIVSVKPVAAFEAVRTMKRDEGAFETLLEEFKRGVATAVRPEDVETRLDLGVAYREMGLWSDAIAEFMLALRHARGDQISRALHEVFSTSTCEIGPLREALFPL